MGILMSVREHVDRELYQAVRSWWARARLILHLHSVLEGQQVGCNLNLDTMASMNLTFRSRLNSFKVLLTLPLTYPAEKPIIRLVRKVMGGRDTRNRQEGEEVKELGKYFGHNLPVEHFCSHFVTIMNKIVEKWP